MIFFFFLHTMKKITLNNPKSAAEGFFSLGLKNEFETAVVNEPSVFEPSKFYCMFTCPFCILFGIVILK